MDRFSAVHMYKYYIKNNPASDVTYTLFKYTVSKFFKKSVIKILDGETFYLGHKLGTIRIKRVERDFSRPTIDWYETNKLKAEGISKHIYYTDDDWCRWCWEKNKAPLKNKSVYKFNPSEGRNGNKKALVKRLKTDEFAHLNYKF